MQLKGIVFGLLLTATAAARLKAYDEFESSVWADFGEYGHSILYGDPAQRLKNVYLEDRTVQSTSWFVVLP